MATQAFTSIKALPLVDTLLKDIARRIQLSPTDYRLAAERYGTICEWLEREDSQVAHVFKRLYPQGSMAIGATIASKLKNDEFDIDVIAELDISPDTAPSVVLDNLFDAINGEKGSRYNGKVHRRSRCVTVEYDHMHIDITPAVPSEGMDPRTSTIFHAHEDEPPEMHKHIVANPWGFADWFEDETPSVREIVEEILFRDVAEPVPDQTDVLEKSMPLVALQLLKRWRNKCYDDREGRCPPSVVLAYFVASNASPARDLFTQLRDQVVALLRVFEEAEATGDLVEVRNPRCWTDILTDRWPGNPTTQRVFLNDLRELDAELRRIERDPSVENCSEVMSRLFGENPTRVVFEDFQKRFEHQAEKGALFTNARNGGIALGASGLSSSASAVQPVHPIPAHRDFGTDA